MSKRNKRKRKKRSLRKPLRKTLTLEKFEKTGLLSFWLKQGANCLCSDYENKIWRPIVDAADTETSLLETIRQAKNAAAQNKDGLFALAWCQQESQKLLEAYLYVYEQIKSDPESGHAKDEIKDPYNDHVWGFFHSLKQNMTELLKEG